MILILVTMSLLPGVIRYKNEEDVYKEADVVSIHVPMTPETRTSH